MGSSIPQGADRPGRHSRGTGQFRITETPRCVQIVSHAGIPAALGLDQRQPCVAARRIALSQGSGARLASAKDARLIDGSHDFGPTEGWRWTNGTATVPTSLIGDQKGTSTLGLHPGAAVHCTTAA